MNYQKSLKSFESQLSADGLQNARHFIDQILESGLDAERVAYFDESTLYIDGSEYKLKATGGGDVEVVGPNGPQMRYVAAFFLLAPDFTRDGPLMLGGKPNADLIQLVKMLQEKREADILGATENREEDADDQEIEATPKPANQPVPEREKTDGKRRGRKPKEQLTEISSVPTTATVTGALPQPVIETPASIAQSSDLVSHLPAIAAIQKTIREIQIPRDLLQNVITSNGTTLELLPWVETLSLLQDAIPGFSVVKEEVTYGHGRVVVSVTGEIPTAEGPWRMCAIGIASMAPVAETFRPEPEYLAHAAAFNRMAMMFGLRRETWRQRSVEETAGSFETGGNVPSPGPVPAPTPSPYFRPQPEVSASKATSIPEERPLGNGTTGGPPTVGQSTSKVAFRFGKK